MPSPEARAEPGAPPAAPVFDAGREVKIAAWLSAAVLLVLTAVKPIGPIPILGPIALTVAAVVQLYLPLWRIDTLGLDHDFLGLHTRTWRRDLRLVLLWSAVVFPPYAVAHWLFMTRMHGWALELGLPQLAELLPRLHLRPHLPRGPEGWLSGSWWLLSAIATHGLGVALPEETFYRGYLQPRLEHRWPPVRRILGVPLGRAAVLASLLFAAGHFLGEWNPLRFGPFFPALIFAWQRNATGSILGAIVFHASCNLLGEILSTQYAVL